MTFVSHLENIVFEEFSSDDNILNGVVISVKEGVAFVPGLPNRRKVQFSGYDVAFVTNLYDKIVQFLNKVFGDDQEITQDNCVLALERLVDIGEPIVNGNNFNYNKVYKTKTCLTKKIKFNNIHRRGMLSGKSIFVARAAYHCMSVLTNNDTLNQVTKNNPNPFIKEMVAFSLDGKRGIPQHKNTFFCSITNAKFDVKLFYDEFGQQTGFSNSLEIIPAKVDPRVNKEMPILRELLERYNDTISSVQINSDTVVGNFHGQIQSNHDFWVRLKGRNFVKKCLGFPLSDNFSPICRPHDEKGGMAMLENTTKGHLGVLYFDENGQNIQMTSEPITSYKLFKFNETRINRLQQVMEIDGNLHLFQLHLNKAKNFLQGINPNDLHSVMVMNEKIQNYLWENIHSDPRFKRSVSFIFVNNLSSFPLLEDEKFYMFKEKFCSLLDNKLYDLNRPQDKLAVLRALLLAYHEKVDPLIIQKLHYLHYNGGIILNPRFLNDVVNYIKSHLGL